MLNNKLQQYYLDKIELVARKALYPKTLPNEDWHTISLAAFLALKDILRPHITDNDAGEIIVTFNNKELRSWTYTTETERKTKMLYAYEYIDGWHDGRNTK